MKSILLIIAIAAGVVGVAALVVGLIALEGLIIWALWNALVPSLASGPNITYIQGILIGIALSVLGTIFGKR